jgi:hypothetical protein
MLSTIPFSGFYETIHDNAIDRAIELLFENDGGDCNSNLINIYYGYLQTDTEEKTYKWKLCGPDGYEIENVIEWAYATPTRTKH